MRSRKNLKLKLAITGLSLLLGSSAFAAGKGSSTNNPSCGVPGTNSTPMPIRNAVLGPVGTKIFTLPNGQANLSTDLQVLMLSAAAESTAFAPMDPQASYPCGEHIEIRSAVSSLQLDIVDAGVSVGYTPNGNLGPVTGISGSVGVKVGMISMDFSLWKCNSNGCSAIAATNSNHTVASGSLNFTVNFGVVNTGPSLMINSPLAKIFRAMMKDGMTKLSQSARVNDLPWQALVEDSTPEVGSFIFNAGTQDRLGINQSFEVYAPVDSSTSGVCNVFSIVASAHTVGVGSVSSTALIDQTYGSRSVQRGDVVMIRKTSR